MSTFTLCIDWLSKNCLFCIINIVKIVKIIPNFPVSIDFFQLFIFLLIIGLEVFFYLRILFRFWIFPQLMLFIISWNKVSFIVSVSGFESGVFHVSKLIRWFKLLISNVIDVMWIIVLLILRYEFTLIETMKVFFRLFLLVWHVIAILLIGISFVDLFLNTLKLLFYIYQIIVYLLEPFQWKWFFTTIVSI